MLNPDQLLRLSKHTVKHNISAGEQLFPRGVLENRNANILRGVVKLSKLTSDGRQQIVGLQFAPDFLGRPFGNQAEMEVEASEDAKLCSFPKSALEELIKESPELGHKLHEQSLRELDEAREWMLALGRKSAPERVAAFFSFLAEHSDPEGQGGSGGSVTIDIPLKRTEIADFLGLTIETVSRQISKLRQAGLLVLTGNRTVTITDLAKLRQNAEQELD